MRLARLAQVQVSRVGCLVRFVTAFCLVDFHNAAIIKSSPPNQRLNLHCTKQGKVKRRASERESPHIVCIAFVVLGWLMWPLAEVGPRGEASVSALSW